jgi:hypothetical protein
MKPRLYAVNNRKGCNEKEAFDLDIADYQEAYQTENYLSRDFTERFKYPYRSLVFFPRMKVLKHSVELCFFFYCLYFFLIYRATRAERIMRRFSGRKTISKSAAFV